jgi:hypothetical protein
MGKSLIAVPFVALTLLASACGLGGNNEPPPRPTETCQPVDGVTHVWEYEEPDGWECEPDANGDGLDDEGIDNEGLSEVIEDHEVKKSSTKKKATAKPAKKR